MLFNHTGNMLSKISYTCISNIPANQHSSSGQSWGVKNHIFSMWSHSVPAKLPPNDCHLGCWHATVTSEHILMGIWTLPPSLWGCSLLLVMVAKNWRIWAVLQNKQLGKAGSRAAPSTLTCWYRRTHFLCTLSLHDILGTKMSQVPQIPVCFHPCFANAFLCAAVNTGKKVFNQGDSHMRKFLCPPALPLVL